LTLQFHLLGTAAGGGLPQWNCLCRQCDLARREPLRVYPRTQQQACFSTDGEHWFLLGASPDLRQQLASFPPLWPRAVRTTLIAGIVLLSADLDGVLGLLLLREFTPLTIYSTAPVRRALLANPFFAMLTRVPGQLTWVEITPGVAFTLGEPPVTLTPLPLGDQLPFYAGSLDGGAGASIGLLLEHDGRKLVYTPGVPHVSSSLLEHYAQADAVFVDGSFWSDSELSGTHSGTPQARAIGHQPLSGPDGTLAALGTLPASTVRILVHINNTNPILDPDSPEHAQALAAGWQIPRDGWQL
jgi:pyrroloquinoline quinone biosynthesis protein B